MNDITIRSIQHYLYCQHRWGLLEIDKAWSENYFVTRGNLIHKRVNENIIYKSRGKKIFTSVPVYNDDYNIYGIVDCIEYKISKNGVNILNYDNKYNLCIVEYKPTKPKDKEYSFEDVMQVFVQKLCVDYIFNSDCDAVLYYADVKKRFYLPLKENFNEYNSFLKVILDEIKSYVEKGIIPPIKKGQNCNGCSMIDMYIPSFKYRKTVKQNIFQILEE